MEAETKGAASMSESAWKRNLRLSHARGVKKATESAARFGTSNPAANYKTAIDRIIAAETKGTTMNYGITIDPSGARTILRYHDNLQEAVLDYGFYAFDDEFEGMVTLFIQDENGETLDRTRHISK